MGLELEDDKETIIVNTRSIPLLPDSFDRFTVLSVFLTYR